MANYWVFQKYDHLQDAVKRFFEILDTKEENSNGNEFHPNRMDFENRVVSSCRAYTCAELKDLFGQMKVLSGYRQAEEMKDWGI